MAELRGDKKIIAEVMMMYRDNPCLWDFTNPSYTNKAARSQAYDVLAEKYRELDSVCDHWTVKRKLENMRTTYTRKRQREKIVQSQFRNDGCIAKPVLWYYSLFTFLDQLETARLRTLEDSETQTTGSILSGDNKHEENKTDSESEPEERRPVKREYPLTSFIKPENDEDHELEMPSSSSKIAKNTFGTEENDEDPITSFCLTSENDLFGKTISTQLSELRPKQRFIAQKLISDVIFYGRLDRLKTDSKLHLDSD